MRKLNLIASLVFGANIFGFYFLVPIYLLTKNTFIGNIAYWIHQEWYVAILNISGENGILTQEWLRNFNYWCSWFSQCIPVKF